MTIFSLNKWFEIAERGTSGDQVINILYSWKSHENEQVQKMHELKNEVDKLTEALEKCKRKHYYCEDCWYSCPKADGGCCNEADGDECNCGADKFNAWIDSVLAEWGGEE